MGRRPRGEPPEGLAPPALHLSQVLAPIGVGPAAAIPKVIGDGRVVRVDGDEVRLTPTEFSLLKHLAVNAGRVLTHPMILGAVWGPEYVSDTQLLRTYINQLRTKLRDDRDAPRFIRTDPGVGYRFAALAES